jgi:general secretion pathway protein D
VLIAGQRFEGFDTRKANTTAVVEDGHTLVIGGIIQERVRKARNGIPFLSSIPVLGYLFGTTTDVVEKRELIILITPHVVTDKEEADVLTEEYRNRIKDVKRKIDEMQSRYRQSRIIPDNPASVLEPVGKEPQMLPAGQ